MKDIKIIYEFYNQFREKRKRQFLFVSLLMISSSFVEAFSVVSILPFLEILLNPTSALNYPVLGKIFYFTGIKSNYEIIITTTILFVSVALGSGILRTINLWINSKFSALIGNEISEDAFRNNIYQNYSYHLNLNTSEVISILTSEMSRSAALFKLFLNLITALLFIIIILLGSLFFFPRVIFSIFVFVFIIYTFLNQFTQKRLILNGKIISRSNSQHIKILQESLGNIRNVLIDNSHSFYLNEYRKIDYSLRTKIEENRFIVTYPRFLVESLGVLILAIIAFLSFILNKDIQVIIPLLGFIALSTQKLLPSCQIVYSCWNGIKERLPSLKKILFLFQKKESKKFAFPKIKKINFKKQIVFDKVGFFYIKENSHIFRNINLTINAGDCIGVIGSTGSGKSTLIDLLLGLLTPTEGSITADGILLNKKNSYDKITKLNVSHVPQNIYLSDDTILNNIALGIPNNKINHQLIKNVANKALLSKFIDSLPNKYSTMVGERGVRLSGGQTQRIGIARALYKSSNLLILDEATSSLDVGTESSIMAFIERLRKDQTIIIVAHRISTLNKCNRILEIKNGKIIEKTYKDIQRTSNDIEI